ncbi:hypothetical protein CDL15_Pgr004140 [Punica granatum]|uniref:Glycosyltransferase n=1 Tax=Punica granatum TaxID=22663 RepID=A0A218XG33_PUNGR|nr:hypothetical protein CDL15_Pgr004140 [Punica granatum]
MGIETHNQQRIHTYFFPFMAHGHMLPIVDMANLFASRGQHTTIVTTPLNAPEFSHTIQRTQVCGTKIDVKTIKFPSVEAGLPEGCENLDGDMMDKFIKAIRLLQQPLEQLPREHCPDCLVADIFFPWATDVANKFGIPRLLFHGTSFFSLCASECIRLYEPHKKLSSDYEPFVIPNFPDSIELTRAKLPEYLRCDNETDLTKLICDSKESELRSYGIIVNSFYELEPAYADHYRNVLKRRAWHIGPVSLCNRDIEDKAKRGKKPAIDEHECLKWLDSKEPNSVIYISFGSIARFNSSQLREIALALVASGHQFVWVIRRLEDEKDEEGFLPDGFEKRMEGKGLIIREWAPQLLILDHRAVGAFLTHCGWNSTLEGICAGVPMVTWPVAAEQFYNEKFITHVLRTGVRVGARRWVGFQEGGGCDVGKEAIKKAICEVMEGEGAESIRNKAKALAAMARKAIEEGGSSYCDLNALIEEFGALKAAREARKDPSVECAK